MASTYAHYRFGKEVLKRLPAHIEAQIMQNMNLYMIGLHGPDILFYYKALFQNPVNQVGYDMHAVPAKKFFAHALKIVKETHNRHNELSYVYGFICHFVLDSAVHGYIDEKISASGVAHTEIEVEFDRMLMIRDGYDPLSHSLTGHFEVKDEDCKVIAEFFPDLSETDIKKSIKSMKSYNALLLAPQEWKRRLIYAILKVTGNYREMHGCIVNRKANPKCKDSNEKLDELYTGAVSIAADLITEFHDTFITGKDVLNQRYEKTFGADQGDSK